MTETRTSERWFRRHEGGFTTMITEAFAGVFFVDVQDAPGRSVAGRTQVCAEDGRIEAARVLRHDFDHRCSERCGEWVSIGMRMGGPRRQSAGFERGDRLVERPR